MIIEPITRANSREMVQRYQETYGFLKTSTGKKILVDISHIDISHITCADSKGNKYQLVSDTGLELEFTQVPSSWFHINNKFIVYVTRKAERQWKRGICHANTSIMTPRKDGKSLYQLNVTPGRIEQLFYPTGDDRSFEKDCSDLNCGIWSKYFAWAENSVYVRDVLIGTVDHKDKTIKLDDDLFMQEMRDALVRSNSDYKVNV